VLPQPRSGAAWREPLALALAGVLVGTVAVVAAVRLREPAAPPPLAVTAITAAVEPAGGSGHCPNALFTMRATITTNGAPGTITYQWIRPDGSLVAPNRVVVRGGDRAATVTLTQQYSGTTPAQGVAALHVISPVSVYSEPLRVAYECP
jgi:hypothetical protein